MKRHALLTGVFALATFLAASGDANTARADENAASAAIDLVDADLPASASAQIAALVKEKESRTPAQRKIASQLLYAKSGVFARSMTQQGAAKASDRQITSLMKTDKAGRVLVDIKGDLGGGLERRVSDVSGKVVNVSAAHQAIRAWVSLAKLETLAAQPAVKSIHPAFLAKTDRVDAPGTRMRLTREQRVALVQKYLKDTAGKRATRNAGHGGPASTNAGAVTSEGSVAEAATRARKYFNIDGAGVTIGVLSDSDDFKEDSIASGDLPADTITIPGQDGRPGSGEGTAMMEIVHDIAPGAKLVFASAFNGPNSFADNIRSLRFDYHCDIIVDDIIYYVESPFQDDIIAQAVNDVSADGAVYFSSAGNQGNKDDGTSGTWEGDFKSGGKLATLPAGYTVNNFGNKVISNRIQIGGGPLYLAWSDPGTMDVGQSSNDYDLFVLSPDLRTVEIASTDIQDGDDIPSEFLGFNVPDGYRVVIAKKTSAQPRALRLVLGNGALGFATAGATYGHNSAKDAIGVGAVDIAEANGGEFLPGKTTSVELYSSDGLRRMFYDEDGNKIKGSSVLLAGTGGETRRKPDISGADGVVTTLPGGSGLNPFFGTSAAAPHVAAIAGLIKSAVPSVSATRIRSAIRNSGLDIEQTGFDRNSGGGVSSAFKALKGAGAPAQVFLELGSVSFSALGGGTLNPGSTGLLTNQLVNNGGAGATSVTGTLTSSTPGVTITQPTGNFGNLAAGASSTNSVPYQFDVSPAVSCGATLQFSESVGYNGLGTKPRVFSLAAQTGSPSSVVTTFTYSGPPVAIPDGNSAGVDIVIPVTGIGSLGKLGFSIDGETCSIATGSTTVGLDHSWVGDLTLKLRSPGGTQVTLMERPGGTGNSGNNFCKTVLSDDAATSIQSITSTGAPFTGSFKPASPLATLAGVNADGDWTLNVSDGEPIDTGNVRTFSIAASGFTCTP